MQAFVLASAVCVALIAAPAVATTVVLAGAEGVAPVVDGAVSASVGPGARVSVGPDGAAWIVTADGRLMTARDGAMAEVLCCARDVGVGADGTVVVVKDNGDIARRTDTGWEGIPGKANRVDVAPDGTVWVVNDAGAVFRTVRGAFAQVPALGSDIGVGASGAVFLVSPASHPGVWRFNGLNWTQVPGAGGVAIDVDDAGRPWVVGFDGRLSSPTGVLAAAGVTDVGVGGSAPVVSSSPLRPGTMVALKPRQSGRFVRLNAQTGLVDASGEVPSLPPDWTWERFLVIDGGDGQIALFNTTLRRLLRLNDRGVPDVSSESPGGLPDNWAWERFVPVDAGAGQVALYSRAHGRFLRMSAAGAADSLAAGLSPLPADPSIVFDVVPTVAAVAAAAAPTAAPTAAQTPPPAPPPPPPASLPAPITRYRGDFVLLAETLRFQAELTPQLQALAPHSQLRGEAFSRHLYESDDLGVGFYAGVEMMGIISMLTMIPALLGVEAAEPFTGVLGETIGSLVVIDGGLNARFGTLYLAFGGHGGIGAVPTDGFSEQRALQNQALFGLTGLVGYGIDNDTFVALKLRAGNIGYDGASLAGLRAGPELIVWRSLGLPFGIFNPNGVFATLNVTGFQQEELQRVYANAAVGISF